MRHRALVMLLALSAGLAACVGGSKKTSEADKQRLKAYILDQAPANLPGKLTINYDNKLELVGYKVQPAGTVKPGQKVTVTMYWKPLKKLDDGWNLFTHVLDGSGERILNLDNVGPLREWRESGQVLGPSNWEPGKIYADEQSFTVPANVKTSRIQLVTGVWKEAERLPIVKGPHDRENRGIVATLNTSTKSDQAPVTRVPMIRAEKLPAGNKIVIDGKLDDEVWKTTPSTGPFVDVATGRRSTTFPVSATVKVRWDDAGMYFGFDVKDPDVVGGFPAKAKDPHLWTKDTVEIMIDPEGDGDNKDYYEIQINPQNLVFDSQFDDYNAPKQEPDGPFGHQEWSAGLKSAVTVNGTIDKSDDKDEGYVVEAMLPWKSLKKAKQVPPELGTIWRVNFYAMQNNSGVAWSAILGQGNFHKASRFGRLMFTEKGWSPRTARTLRGDGGMPPLRRVPFGMKPGGHMQLPPPAVRAPGAGEAPKAPPPAPPAPPPAAPAPK